MPLLKYIKHFKIHKKKYSTTTKRLAIEHITNKFSNQNYLLSLVKWQEVNNSVKKFALHTATHHLYKGHKSPAFLTEILREKIKKSVEKFVRENIRG